MRLTAKVMMVVRRGRRRGNELVTGTSLLVEG